MKDKMNNNLLNKRLIAFLDVLGFSSLIEKSTLEEIYDKYSIFINDAKNATFFQNENDLLKRTNFEFGKFISDSLILISNPVDDIHNVNNFLMAVSHILSLGFKSHFPLRGSIGLSDVILDDERGIVLSKELPFLLKEEKSQDWVGCSILEDALDIVMNSVGGSDYRNSIINTPCKSNLIQYYEIPYKDGAKLGFAINYAYSLNDTDIKNGLDYLITTKKENTQKYISFYKTLPVDKTVTCPTNINIIKTRSGFSISLIA